MGVQVEAGIGLIGGIVTFNIRGTGTKAPACHDCDYRKSGARGSCTGMSKKFAVLHTSDAQLQTELHQGKVPCVDP